MFVLFIFPRLKKYAIVLCGLFFIFWKLPISENFITFYNKFAIIPITRVVDYTDLIALFVLPISYVLLKNIDYYRILKSNLKLNPLMTLLSPKALCKLVIVITFSVVSVFGVCSLTFAIS